MKYQVNIFFSLQVEAESEEQAEEKAGTSISPARKQGVRLSDMSIEIKEIEKFCNLHNTVHLAGWGVHAALNRLLILRR